MKIKFKQKIVEDRESNWKDRESMKKKNEFYY